VIKPLGPQASQVGPIGSGAAPPRLGNEAGRLLVGVAHSLAQLPELSVGESVNARLVERLPNRQWIAMVKDAPFTLRLPAPTPDDRTTRQPSGSAEAPDAEPATPFTKGAMLSLRVASLTPRLSFVLVGAAPAAAAAGSQASLSDAARYLSALVRAGESRPLPAGAASPAPPAQVSLLPADPSATAAGRAQSLAQAVRHSGLFYESHLRAWADGRMTLDQVHDEPQARAGQWLQEDNPQQRASATAELGRLLQRQLDSLDGRPLLLSGMAWPGQTVEWTIEREPDGATETDAGDDPSAWSTQLHLMLPRLGQLGASLRVVGSNVQLRFATDNAATAAVLDRQREALAERLLRAGLQLNTWAVEHEAAAPKP
jgi:hypothetical protein